jgi:hypothetical protein
VIDRVTSELPEMIRDEIVRGPTNVVLDFDLPLRQVFTKPGSVAMHPLTFEAAEDTALHGWVS